MEGTDSDQLGSCSIWSQCQNKLGSWAVVLCIENTCMCNPYWGYGGENCMEPSTLTIVQRYLFSVLFVAVIFFVILSLFYVKSYILKKKDGPVNLGHKWFRWNKMNEKDLAIIANAFISAPCAFLIVFGGLSAVTFDPQMNLLASTFEISFAVGVLGVSLQNCVLGLTWMKAVLSIRHFKFLKDKWKTIKFMTYTYVISISTLVLVLHLIRKSLAPRLAITFESIANVIVIVQVIFGLLIGRWLSSHMMKYGVKGSETYIEGKMIRKCALQMLFLTLGYGLFAAFRSGVAGYGWLLAMSNGLCVLFGFLYEMVFLFYLDNTGIYFKTACRKNMYRAQVHPISFNTSGCQVVRVQVQRSGGALIS
mmetsp:Transcript_8998/g.11947  ORF Transcript_8998/g.11947 Transcript_8998/m.11947 type:complete len:364 (+) Transcript_8998:146-1237(+)